MMHSAQFLLSDLKKKMKACIEDSLQQFSLDKANTNLKKKLRKQKRKSYSEKQENKVVAKI